MAAAVERLQPQNAAHSIQPFMDILGCAADRCDFERHGTDTLSCRSCRRGLRLSGSMVMDAGLAFVPNALEDIDYDARHGVSVEASRHLGGRWRDIIGAHLPLGAAPDILEIGAGTGLLTLGLAMAGGFNRLIASDISAKFLAVAQARVEGFAGGGAALAARLRYLVCTIDDLPLRPQSVDAVVANSVLHHIYDVKLALTRIRRILRPGGVAMFSEPVIQGKAFIGFLAAVIGKLDGQAARPVFDATERQKLDDLATLCTRGFWETTAELVKDSADDKHLFDIEGLRRTARELGFRAVEAFPYDPVTDGLRLAVEDSLTIMQIRTAPLQAYQDIFTAFQKQVIDQIPASVCTPHAFIVISN